MRQTGYFLRRLPLLAAVFVTAVPSIIAAEPPGYARYEDASFRMNITPRTPEQIAAFYEARGFPEGAVVAASEACFVTVGIHNKSDTIVWLELDSWRVASGVDDMKRLDRVYWREQWQRLQVPEASQSTFGWTLLPEVRDLHPHELVGGNITLTRTDALFTLEAHFATGRDRKGEEIVVRFENVRCAEDPSTP